MPGARGTAEASVAEAEGLRGERGASLEQLGASGEFRAEESHDVASV